MVLTRRYVAAFIAVSAISLCLFDDLRDIDLREVHQLVDNVLLVAVDALHLEKLLNEAHLLRLFVATLHYWLYAC